MVYFTNLIFRCYNGDVFFDELDTPGSLKIKVKSTLDGKEINSITGAYIYIKDSGTTSRSFTLDSVYCSSLSEQLNMISDDTLQKVCSYILDHKLNFKFKNDTEKDPLIYGLRNFQILISLIVTMSYLCNNKNTQILDEQFQKLQIHLFTGTIDFRLCNYNYCTKLQIIGNIINNIIPDSWFSILIKLLNIYSKIFVIGPNINKTLILKNLYTWCSNFYLWTDKNKSSVITGNSEKLYDEISVYTTNISRFVNRNEYLIEKITDYMKTLEIYYNNQTPKEITYKLFIDSVTKFNEFQKIIKTSPITNTKSAFSFDNTFSNIYSKLENILEQEKQNYYNIEIDTKIDTEIKEITNNIHILNKKIEKNHIDTTTAKTSLETADNARQISILETNIKKWNNELLAHNKLFEEYNTKILNCKRLRADKRLQYENFVTDKKSKLTEMLNNIKSCINILEKTIDLYRYNDIEPIQICMSNISNCSEKIKNELYNYESNINKEKFDVYFVELEKYKLICKQCIHICTDIRSKHSTYNDFSVYNNFLNNISSKITDFQNLLITYIRLHNQQIESFINNFWKYNKYEVNNLINFAPLEDLRLTNLFITSAQYNNSMDTYKNYLVMLNLSTQNLNDLKTYISEVKNNFTIADTNTYITDAVTEMPEIKNTTYANNNINANNNIVANNNINTAVKTGIDREEVYKIMETFINKDSDTTLNLHSKINTIEENMEKMESNINSLNLKFDKLLNLLNKK
jgi:hypothetical protein